MKRAPVKPIQLLPEHLREIESAVFNAVEQALDSCFYLLSVALEKEAGYWYLRLYVEKKDSAISINDCEQISRVVDPIIEALPALSTLVYNLEISSPGLFRPLKSQREFDFYKGRSVRIETPQPIVKGKKKAESSLMLTPQDKTDLPEGILQAYDAAKNTVILQKSQTNELFEVILNETKLVCLNPVVHFPEDNDSLEDSI